MRILTIDIGTGTQDILLFDSDGPVENGAQLVMPAPTQIVARKVRAATQARVPIALTGVIMGGGPCHWAVEDHLRAGLTVYATPAAILGALEDPRVAGQDDLLIANVGNFHCLAFHLSGGAIAGCFEHHTGELQPAQLEGFLLKLADGTLSNQEIFESMGHGALVLRPTPGARPFLAVTGPRRAMLRGSALMPYFAVPHGDMMLA